MKLRLSLLVLMVLILISRSRREDLRRISRATWITAVHCCGHSSTIVQQGGRRDAGHIGDALVTYGNAH